MVAIVSFLVVCPSTPIRMHPIQIIIACDSEATVFVTVLVPIFSNAAQEQHL